MHVCISLGIVSVIKSIAKESPNKKGIVAKNSLTRHGDPCLRDLLPGAVGLDADYHSKALDPFSGGVIFQRRLYERSLYACILMYNKLPQATVDLPTVSAFQAQLTHLAKNRVTLDPENWRSSFQSLADVVRMLYG